MANNDGQWNAALAAAAAAIGVKALDLLGGWWNGGRNRQERTSTALITAETDERRDFIGEAKDLRERFDKLQEKYALSLEERATLRGENQALTLRVNALEQQQGASERRQQSMQEAFDAERKQWAAERDSFRKDLEELRRRVPPVTGHGE